MPFHASTLPPEIVTPVRIRSKPTRPPPHAQARNQNTDPEVQVHAYNATTYIIRQNKCRTFEAPFIYVLIGTVAPLAT